MDTKTIALDREAYEVLRDEKRKGESFSEVVKRLAGKRRPLTDFVGLWKDVPKEDLRSIEDAIRRGRERDRDRLRRLMKRLG